MCQPEPVCGASSVQDKRNVKNWILQPSNTVNASDGKFFLIGDCFRGDGGYLNVGAAAEGPTK